MLPERNNEAVSQLQQKLQAIWTSVRDNDTFSHTSVIVPSLSVDQEELSKVQGASFYEERLLFALIRLRNPNARLIYVTSQPVHPDVVDYYLQLLVGVPAAHAKRRLQMVCLYDDSPRALTEKVLERPRVLKRLREWIAEHGPAYLTCYNTTMLERQLALELQVPLNGVDPLLLPLGERQIRELKVFIARIPVEVIIHFKEVFIVSFFNHLTLIFRLADIPPVFYFVIMTIHPYNIPFKSERGFGLFF